MSFFSKMSCWSAHRKKKQSLDIFKELHWTPKREKISGTSISAVRYASMVNVSGELKDCVYKHQISKYAIQFISY